MDKINEKIENNIIDDEKPKKKHKILIVIFMIIFILVMILLYSHFIATHGLIVKEYKIVNQAFVENFYGLKIVHLSDIHYGETTNKTDLEKIVNEINLLKPDIVVFTGDLYSSPLNDDQLNELKETLSNIKVNIDKYFILGNHDEENVIEIMKSSGFIDLNNNYDLIYNNNGESILLAGINTNGDVKEDIKVFDQFFNQDNTDVDDNDVNNNIAYKILLLHEPDKILELDYSHFDLILAGHSHNGQIRLPIIGAITTPNGAKKYYDEFYDLEGTNLYISSGIGTSVIKFRFFNRPSINFYRLVKE